jgi:hypothetical protein
MSKRRHTRIGNTLQGEFARALGRRAERRVFVDTLRRIATRLGTLEPLVVLQTERRRVPREA